MRLVGRPTLAWRLLSMAVALGLTTCDKADESLPEVTHVPSGLECYPVNYLRPPYGPPSESCPLPQHGEDVLMVLLIATDGETFDAYVPGEASPALDACVLREARTRSFEPARDCNGRAVASRVHLKYSSMFGHTCMPVECGRTTR